VLKYRFFRSMKDSTTFVRQIQILPSGVGARLSAKKIASTLQPVNDCHSGGPVHPKSNREICLSNAWMIVNQPQHSYLLLCQFQISECFGKVPVYRTVGKADMKANDIAELADIASPLFRRSNGRRSVGPCLLAKRRNPH
jgi:hypothetical protein